MPPLSRRRQTCRLCDSSELQVVVPLEPIPVGDAYVPESKLHEVQPTFNLDLSLCRQCGHLQLLEVPDPKILFSRDYLYVTSVSPGLVEHFQRYADEVVGKLEPAKGALVVEVGSNEGSLLRAFQAKGLRVLGVDAAPEIAARATANGTPTLAEFFGAALGRQIRREHGTPAIVAANNVFAHADDLHDMAEGIRELMGPQSVFIFEVGYVADLLGNSLLDTVYHEHLSYHGVKPLVSFLARHGLELLDVQPVPTKGGSIRCTAQLKGGSRKAAPSVSRFVASEEEQGLSRPEPYQAFAARLEQLRARLGNLVTDLESKGHTLAGFGASVGATTLIYYFRLGKHLRFLVDDNKRKHHLYSPGYHIPVYPPDALYQRKPAYVIMLAWTYSQAIMKKHPQFLQQGGHFIIPLPDIEIH